MRQSTVIDTLRADIAAIEGVAARHAVLPFGLDSIDQRLPGGGIAAGALHEIAGSVDLADDASATIFLGGMLARMEGPVFWCLRWRDLFAPSLYLSGLHPDRVVYVEAGSDTNVLLAMEECLRHSGIAAVVGEVSRYSTTASKRLQLAAEASGVTAFVFRRASMPSALAEGTAAVTRWRISAHPSAPLGSGSAAPGNGSLTAEWQARVAFRSLKSIFPKAQLRFGKSFNESDPCRRQSENSPNLLFLFRPENFRHASGYAHNQASGGSKADEIPPINLSAARTGKCNHLTTDKASLSRGEKPD